MNWIVTVLAVTVSSLFILQGTLFLRHESRHAYLRWIGFLNLLLVALGLVSYGLAASGTLVLAREFGVVLVQGRLAYLGLCILLVGIPLCAGLLLHLVRIDLGARASARGILLAGVVVGAVSVWALTVGVLNVHDPAPLRVRAYDVWWTPFVLWVCGCILQCVLLVVNKVRFRTVPNTSGEPLSAAPLPKGEGVPNKTATQGLRMWLQPGKWKPGSIVAHLFLPAGLGILAIHLSHMGIHFYRDPWTTIMWKVCLLLSLPALAGLGTWLMATRIRKPVKLAASRLARSAISGLVAIVTLLSTVLWVEPRVVVELVTHWFVFPHVSLPIFLPLTIYLICLSIPVLYLSFSLLKTLVHGSFRMPDVGLPRRNDLIWVVISLGVIVLVLADLIYMDLIPSAIDLTFVAVAWLVVSEIATGRQLLAMIQPTTGEKRESAAVKSPLGHALREGRKRTKEAFSGLGKSVKEALGTKPYPLAVFKVIVGAFVGIVLLVALSEIPNAGKTLIHQFSVDILGQKEQDANKLGSIIADRVLVHVGTLERDLQPDAVLLVPGSKGQAKSEFVPLVGGEVNLATALGTSKGISLGGVEIPIKAIAPPIQYMMRRLLNARSIYGTFYARSDSYSLLAYSSSGESWEAAPKSKVSAEGSREAAPNSKVSVEQAATDLADDLAFKIITTDPGLSSLGMTHSGEAFKEFQSGLKAWKQYEAGQFDSLKEAITHFREATKTDNKFAMAYYRLGLALRADGQPAASVEALRGSIKARRNFVSGYIALAYTLIAFDQYYPLTAPALEPVPESSQGSRESRLNEVRHLLQNVLLFPRPIVSLNSRGSAFYGLCNVAFNQEQNILAYFYCKRAEQAYAKLPRWLQSNLVIRQTRAAALNAIGVTLVAQRITWPDDKSITWNCSANEISPNDEGVVKYYHWESPYSGAALHYFERALAFDPDDPTIECNAAEASLAHKAPWRMDELKEQASAHVVLGNDLAYLAQREQKTLAAAQYFHQALHEYAEAIAIARYNVDALNGYAYTFWVWRESMPTQKPPVGPSPEDAHLAEKYAREAKRLVIAREAPVATEVMTESSLGEVLLGQGRCEEAIEVLKRAEDLAPKASQFDEIRWDLAQAYLCQSANDRRAGHLGEAETSLNNAIPLLRTIHENEKLREYQPFTRQSQRLDPRYGLGAPLWEATFMIERKPDSAGPVYKLRGGEPEYSRDVSCDMMHVVADALDEWGAPVRGMKVHVWGGGVDNWILVGEFPQEGEREKQVRQIVYLMAEPRNTHAYYFAQLTDSKDKPVSLVNPIPTYANGAKNGCSRNRIKLTYVKQPYPSGRHISRRYSQ